MYGHSYENLAWSQRSPPSTRHYSSKTRSLDTSKLALSRSGLHLAESQRTHSGRSEARWTCDGTYSGLRQWLRWAAVGRLGQGVRYYGVHTAGWEPQASYHNDVCGLPARMRRATARKSCLRPRSTWQKRTFASSTLQPVSRFCARQGSGPHGSGWHGRVLLPLTSGQWARFTCSRRLLFTYKIAEKRLLTVHCRFAGGLG